MLSTKRVISSIWLVLNLPLMNRQCVYAFNGLGITLVGQMRCRKESFGAMKRRHNQGSINGFGLQGKRAVRRFIILVVLKKRFNARLDKYQRSATTRRRQ
jgi:hypothetical protein